MDKEDVAHTWNGILLSHEKWNNAICSNMDGPRDYHTKWSKSEREKNIIWYHIYIESKKIMQWTPVQNKLMATKEEKCREG